MKRSAISFALAILAAAALAGGGYWLGQRHGEGASASMPAKAEPARRILYWQDPMVPGPRFDKPGKSPYMDMPLVPVYADEGKGAGGVAIDPRVQQNLGLRTGEVTEEDQGATWTAVGNVAWDERSTELVTARSAGYLERLLVRAPFDSVRAGQPLAELLAPDWVAAQEDFLAVRRLGRGTDLLDAARQRLRLVGMTEDQIAGFERTGKVQPRVILRAPRSGQVVELAAREGMTVAAGTPLFRIASLDRVWVNAELAEQAMALVAPGSPVEVSAPALGTGTFAGRVAALLPDVDVATRTRKARIELPNPGLRLQPGMFVNVTLHDANPRRVLTVPSEAIIQTGTRSLVYLAEEGGRYRPVDVSTGQETGGRTEVRTGLARGQKVVVSAQFLVDSEASLRGISATKLAPMAAPESHGEHVPAPAPRTVHSSPSAAPPASVPAPAQPSAAAPQRHHGSGRIEKVDAHSVTISHGPVATMGWPAMTMAFELPPGMGGGLQVGQMVDFAFSRAASGFRIESITPVHADAGAKP